MSARRFRAEPLPPFRTGAEVVLAALGGLRPPRKVTVAESAERWRVLKNAGGGYSGPWRHDFAPYLVEPMQALSLREVLEVCILGPAQFGKTEIILNLAVHEIAEGGADCLILEPSQLLAEDFAERRLGKAFEASEALRGLIGTGRGDDKRLSKLGRNGARVTVAWPVASQLSSRPVPKVVLDELDSMPDDIGGEGDPVTLARARTTSFGRAAKILTASTPKRQDGSGIVARWRSGDRRLWAWPCAHCGEYFTPGFDAARRPTLAHLYVRPNATEEEARAEAGLLCPHCGGLLGEHHKAGMNARGVWLPDGVSITADGALHGGAVRSSIRSYWFSGLAQRNRTWADLAGQYVVALRKVQETQDETELRAWWNTAIGAPYRSILSTAQPIEPEELEARAEDLPLGVVPAWAGFITAAVDVQANRFDCLAVAWGAEGRCQVIDAWQIFKATDPETGEERMLDPPHRAEDWGLLTQQVVGRSWPVDGGGELAARRIAVDTGGADGTTGQAYAWWHTLAREGETAPRRRVLLIKGASNRDAPLITARKIEADLRGRKLRRGIVLHLLNTEALKDQADLRLRMRRPGAGWVHLPRGLPERIWQELTAEVRGAKGWEKIRARNEAWDLFVYCLAAWHRLGGPRLDWGAPAEWHRPRRALPPAAAPRQAAEAAEAAEEAEEAAAEEVPAPPAPPVAVPRSPVRVAGLRRLPELPAMPTAAPPARGRSRFWKPPSAARAGLGAQRL